MTKLTSLSVFSLLALCTVACSSGGGSNSNPGTAGTTGAGTAGTTGGGGSTATAGTTGAGGGTIVDTPMGTLLMDDFESGAAKWMVTQGTCSIVADSDA